MCAWVCLYVCEYVPVCAAHVWACMWVARMCGGGLCLMCVCVCASVCASCECVRCKSLKCFACVREQAIPLLERFTSDSDSKRFIYYIIPTIYMSHIFSQKTTLIFPRYITLIFYQHSCSRAGVLKTPCDRRLQEIFLTILFFARVITALDFVIFYL